MKTIIAWHLPIEIANEGNSNEHWTKKAKRHRIQKKRIKQEFLKEKPNISTPCTCLLTRIAPRELDQHDNLRTSMKWVVDAIASELTGNYIPGRADSDKNIKWEYDQKRGGIREYALGIKFEYETPDKKVS